MKGKALWYRKLRISFENKSIAQKELTVWCRLRCSTSVGCKQNWPHMSHWQPCLYTHIARHRDKALWPRCSVRLLVSLVRRDRVFLSIRYTIEAQMVAHYNCQPKEFERTIVCQPHQLFHLMAVLGPLLHQRSHLQRLSWWDVLVRIQEHLSNWPDR